jgi:hypothetical protein
MSNPALDQLSDALWWKIVPVIICGGIGAIMLRELLQWLERKATRSGRSRRTRHATQSSPAAESAYLGLTDETPHCPECNAGMVKRKARRGANVGDGFWGCSGYPRCRGTRAL